MITQSNYFQKVKGVDFDSLPKKLKEGFLFAKEVTDNHKTWMYYKKDEDVKSVIDTFFENLSKFYEIQNEKRSIVKNASLEIPAREAAKNLIWNYVKRGDTFERLKAGQLGHSGGEYSASIKASKIYIDRLGEQKVSFEFPLQSIFNEVLEETKQTKKGKQVEKQKPIKKVETKQIKNEMPENTTTNKTIIQSNEVEKVAEEVRFIKRYALLHGKKKTDVQILNFINALQKAILEKRIRKTSKYAKDIQYIQTNLVKLYNVLSKIKHSSKRVAEIKVNKVVLAYFVKIGGSEKVRLSVNYLKRYIGIQGKKLTKDKVERLMTAIKNAAAKKKIIGSDPYADNLQSVFKSMNEFLKVGKRNDTLEVHPGILNGINEALEGCCCDEKKKDDELDGIEQNEMKEKAISPENASVMNSMDFSEMKFQSIGFMGKWLDLIGDPSEGFTAMVFGKPKMGKSYLCIEWAGYLARNHGETLYVAKEEKLDATLQMKLNDKNVKHPNLDVSDDLPLDLSKYKYIFLDSVNKLRLSHDDLEKLENENPGKSFIYIYQTTKAGNFKGANEHQHNVDVVIEVPERGKAVQFGRFNQGGEMEIFDEGTTELMGVGKKDKTEKTDTKRKKSRFPDWTEPKHLDENDWRNLKIIKKYYDEGKFKEAMYHAMYNADTVIREEVPPNVWLEIGGSLTATGKERLKALLKKYPEK